MVERGGAYQRSVFATICDCCRPTCGFVFPGKNLRLVKIWKWESVCWQGQELFYQSQEALLPGGRNNRYWLGEKGLSSILLWMQNNDYELEYFLCVLTQTDSQQVALWARSLVISAPYMFFRKSDLLDSTASEKLRFWRESEKDALTWCCMQSDPLVCDWLFVLVLPFLFSSPLHQHVSFCPTFTTALLITVLILSHFSCSSLFLPFCSVSWRVVTVPVTAPFTFSSVISVTRVACSAGRCPDLVARSHTAKWEREERARAR